MLCALTIGSCVHNHDAQKEIYKFFPNSEIYNVDDAHRYIVIDSVGIYVVQCGVPFTKNIWNVQLIKKWQNQ